MDDPELDEDRPLESSWQSSNWWTICFVVACGLLGAILATCPGVITFGFLYGASQDEEARRFGAIVCEVVWSVAGAIAGVMLSFAVLRMTEKRKYSDLDN